MLDDFFTNKIAFVTGANRGIGAALVQALLERDVKKVYAAARNVTTLPRHGDVRVVPIELDITNPHQVKSAVRNAPDVKILINNAGVLSFAPVIAGSAEYLERDMRVNYFGTLNMARNFTPVLERNGNGSIANICSIAGLAPMANVGGYCASKAALHSATQAMRSELAAMRITVHAIYPGPIDTDMARDLNMQKPSAKITAENIVDGIAKGEEDIFPDAFSKEVEIIWRSDPKALEKRFFLGLTL
jgi:NAD(P)-dependent dehydrogenase (short-subunit alcohol dehydrogenase family)